MIGIWVLAPGAPLFAQAQIPEACPGNRLVNPGFEEGFTRRDRSDVVQPNGWEIWFERLPGIGGQNYPPSYRPIRLSGFVGAGLWSLEQGTRDSTHTGGVFQRVEVGDDVQIRGWGWSSAWASFGSRPEVSEPPGTYASAIGVDPLGGVDPAAPRIVWTSPITTTDAWIEHRLDTPAAGPIVTFFTRGQPLSILPNNVSRWDGLCLQVIGPSGTTPDPAQDARTADALATPPASDSVADIAAGLFATATARAAGVEPEGGLEPELGVNIGAAATHAAAATRVAAGVDSFLPDLEGEEAPAPALTAIIADHLGFIALAGALFFSGLIVGLRGGDRGARSESDGAADTAADGPAEDGAER